MNFVWFSVAGAGAIALVASIVGARHPVIPAWGIRVFRFVNGLPSWLLLVLWVPMQLGNLLVGTAVGLAIAWWAGELDVAIGVIIAMLLKLVSERVLRHDGGVSRGASASGLQRAGRSPRGGDVPSKGPSFPSGHIILVAPSSRASSRRSCPRGPCGLAFFLTLLVMIGSVYVGRAQPARRRCGTWRRARARRSALTAFFGLKPLTPRTACARGIHQSARRPAWLLVHPAATNGGTRPAPTASVSARQQEKRARLAAGRGRFGRPCRRVCGRDSWPAVRSSAARWSGAAHRRRPRCGPRTRLLSNPRLKMSKIGSRCCP